MKRIYLILMGILVSSIIFISCEKEDSPELKKTSKAESITYKLDNFQYEEYNSNERSVTDISMLLTNPEDADDEKINNYLYEISLATKELIKDPAFNNLIIDMARNSDMNCAYLLELENLAPDYFNHINDNLAQNNLSLEKIANDFTHAPIAPNKDYPQTEAIETYYPAIYIPNLDILDNNLQPIISPNIEVDSREDESIEDNIIAWFYPKATSSNVTTTLLSEEISLVTKNPIFLLDNAVNTLDTGNDLEYTPLDNDVTKEEGIVKGSTRKFSTYEHSIRSQSYRYESFWSGKSEFAVSAIRIDPNGTSHWIYNSGVQKVISKIKKNQIGSIRYVWSHHASDWQPWSNPWTPTANQNNVNMVYWNTFERDWNRSDKALGTCTANGTTIYMSGRMKYSSNWYTWIPSTAYYHYTRFSWVNANWAHWNNSWKAKFRIWKVYV